MLEYLCTFMLPKERLCSARLLHPRLVCLGFVFSASIFASQITCADVIDAFADVAGNPTGEFGWDDFGTTGSPYEGPHDPDQFGAGSSLSANTGGLITTTNNLYSFFSVPTWNVDLNGLVTDDAFTSVAVQFATSSSYDSAQFTLGGVAPDEFSFLGQGPEIGGFPINLYWAEWQGLDAASSYSIQLQGTGQHQSLAGAKASYFNTSSSSFDISAVPEPTSMAVVGLLMGLLTFRRGRK